MEVRAAVPTIPARAARPRGRAGCRAALVALGAGLLTLLAAAPAAAATSPGPSPSQPATPSPGSSPFHVPIPGLAGGDGWSATQTILVFAGIPLGIFLLLAILVYVPSLGRSGRVRSDRPWEHEPVTMGVGHDELPGEARQPVGAGRQIPERTGAEEGSGDERGGASAGW